MSRVSNKLGGDSGYGQHPGRGSSTRFRSLSALGAMLDSGGSTAVEKFQHGGKLLDRAEGDRVEDELDVSDAGGGEGAQSTRQLLGRAFEWRDSPKMDAAARP